MTKAVRGTVMSKTAYSAGKVEPSVDSSDEELSGSKTSNGPFGILDFLVFGGLDGSLPPAPGPSSRKSSFASCASLSAPAPKPADMPLMPFCKGEPGPGFRASFCPADGGAHNFLSAQPEFTKASVIGRLAAGGGRGAKGEGPAG